MPNYLAIDMPIGGTRFVIEGEPPSAPTNLAATTQTTSSVSGTYTEATQAEKHILEYSTDQTNWTPVVVTGGAWSVAGLLPSTQYYFRLEASNVFGDSPYTATITRTTSAAAAPPIANFTVSKTNPNVNELVNFTDTSNYSGGAGTSWSWDFGSGATPSTSTAQNPTGISWTTSGAKTVTLTATNASGSDGETKTNFMDVAAPPMSSVMSGQSFHWSSRTETGVWTDEGPVRLVLNERVVGQNAVSAAGPRSGWNAAYFPQSASSTSAGFIASVDRRFQNNKGSLTISAWCKFDSVASNYTGFIWSSYETGAMPYRLTRGQLSLSLQYYDLALPGTRIITLNNAFTAGEAVGVFMIFDAANSQARIKVVRADGSVQSVSGSWSGGINYNSATFYVGGGGSGNPMGGAMAGLRVAKAVWDAVDNSNLTFLYNSGQWRTEAESPQSDNDYGPCPFGNLQSFGTIYTAAAAGTAGLYNYRPWKLNDGSFFAMWSTDHWNSTIPGQTGIWGGVVANRGAAPSSISKLIVTNPSSGGRTLTQLETPWYVYNPSTSFAGEPHWIYAHGEVLTGGPTGLSTPNSKQETHLFTAATITGPYTARGPAVPIKTGPAFNDWTHTGYQQVLPPGSLPNQTQWITYGLGRDASWPSTFNWCESFDGTTFTLPTTFAQTLDGHTPFQSHWEAWNAGCEWFSNLVRLADNRVYGVGRVQYYTNPGEVRTGVGIMEMSADSNGRWTKPTGKSWKIIAPTDVFPNLGYVQGVMAEYDSTTSKLHIWTAQGFYKDLRQQETKYYTLDLVG